MMVLVLTACPPGLRGYLTRWLLEVSAGVFVGHVSKRVRELMWEKTIMMVGAGRAILVISARNEQRLEFRVHGHHWEPVDFDGITLMMRPDEDRQSIGGRRSGWSKASQMRKRGMGL
ncbi:type I-E CRISPR-associated endoribonuclease Cas2e [Luethyella okanaganae]|uniref:Type I-E CRISPR-associated endoribonuclease Cas2e n=1 Tax=Luethyella okanaganae TaxID=69372 RepID=A0ABW1VDA6_9MICO